MSDDWKEERVESLRRFFLQTLSLRNVSHSRDFSYCGEDSVPTTKQNAEVSDLAALFPNMHPEQASELWNGRKILIAQTTAKEKVEHESSIMQRYLFLFNDVLLVAAKITEDGTELYDLVKVLYLRDMKVHDFFYDEDVDANTFAVLQMRKDSLETSYTFVMDSEEKKTGWLCVLENTLVGYHYRSSNVRERDIGFVHNLILGSIYSSSVRGDIHQLRKILNWMIVRKKPIDYPDEIGMSALHWAAMNAKESCVKELLAKGANIDVLSTGGLTPLMLAASRSHENVVRSLINSESNINIRCSDGYDALGLCLLFGYTSKSFLSTMDTLIKKGLDPCQIDSRGRSLIHLAVTFAIPDGISVLIEHGVPVNIRHGGSGLTPLQLACSALDVETFRVLLSKGAASNVIDSKGRRVADVIVEDFCPTGYSREIVPQMTELSDSVESESESTFRKVYKGIHEVGDWVIKVLPCLLEVLKHGGRLDPKHFKESVNPWMRSSLRSAIQDGQSIWTRKEEPPFFLRFIGSKELVGRRFLKTEKEWVRDGSSLDCQMCQEVFSMSIRRHHCRACGLLCCDRCSTKQLQLSSRGKKDRKSIRLSFSGNSSSSGMEDNKSRVCDLCFNKLIGESLAPSLEKVKLKQFKQTAVDLIRHLNGLVESLDGIIDASTKVSDTEDRTNRESKLVTSLQAGMVWDDQSIPDHVDNWDTTLIESSLQHLRSAQKSSVRFADSSIEYVRIAAKIKENLELFNLCSS